MKKVATIGLSFLLLLLFLGCPTPTASESDPNKYSVSYNANGAVSGSVPGIQTKTEGVDLTLASNSGNLVLAGYTFAGWNTSADGTGADYGENASYTTDSDLILYAKWTALPTFSITYESNGAESGSAPENQIKIEGVDLTLASNSGSLIMAGYIFVGWNTADDGSGIDYDEKAFYTADSDLVLYAKWDNIGILPLITNFEYDGPAEIDTSASDQVISFTVTALDDIELKSAQVLVTSPSGSNTIYENCYITSSDYAGSSNKGEFTVYITIPQYSEAGTWTMYGIRVHDHLSQMTAMYTADLESAGWNYTFDQVGAGDLEAPTISAFTMENPPSIDTSAGDQTVSFKVTAADDIELKYAQVLVTSPSGNKTLYNSSYITGSGYTGTSAEGVFTVDITIPQYSEAGTWTMYGIRVYDHLSQMTAMYMDDLTSEGWNYTFEQEGTGDTGAPTISNFVFEGPASIDTSTADQIVSFKVTAEDDIELKYAQVLVTNPSGNKTLYNSSYITGSDFTGTSAEGVFTVNITIPQYSEAGTWTIYGIRVFDHLSQMASMGASELTSAGWGYTFDNQ